MLHILIAAGGSGTFLDNLGGILSGVSSLLAVFGAAIGFLLRYLRNRKRERARIETAARVSSEETRKTLEARLEKAHSEQLASKDKEIADLKEQNKMLLDRLIGDGKLRDD